MKNKNKITLKILSGVVAIILIVGMLFITNAFIGNPFSAMIANKAIKQYVNQNYSFLDLEIEKANYDFKNGGYRANAKSKTSIDTKFAIYYSGGKVQRDDYELFVLGKVNTLNRLSSEYTLIAKTIIANDLGFENNTTYVIHDKNLSENLSEVLELDMKFDKAVPINPEVTIQLDMTDYSLESVAIVLTNAHNAFLDNGCIFAKYGFYAANDEKNIMVIGVTPSDIEGGELLGLLKKAETREDNSAIGKDGDKEPTEGIMIFRKGEKK